MLIWELRQVRGSGQFTAAVVMASSETEARCLISEKAGFDPLALQQTDWMDARSVVCRSIGTATEKTVRIVMFVPGNFLSSKEQLLDEMYTRIRKRT